MDEATLNNLLQLFCLFIGGCLITTITVIVAFVKTYKNKALSKRDRGLWILAQSLFLFPAYIYLIIVEKSWFWKIAGIISTLITCVMIIYTVKNPLAFDPTTLDVSPEMINSLSQP